MTSENVWLEVLAFVVKLTAKQIGLVQGQIGATFRGRKCGLDVGGALQSTQCFGGGQVLDQLEGIVPLVVCFVQ